MRHTLLIMGVALTTWWTTIAAAYDAAAVAEIKQQLQRGVDHGDVAEVLTARARFQALGDLEPRVALLPYWVAVADWRATGLLLNGAHPDRDKAKRHCQAGIAAAERAFQLDPKFGGALAVKVGLQGLSTTFLAPAALMSVGAQMEGDLGRALGLSESDPRVSLFDGINTLHKPPFVGGGPRPALGKLKRAIEQYGADTAADPAAPDWGRDDACLWAGRAAMKLKDYAAAKGFFALALEANPNNGWVRGTLLPAAEQAVAGSAKARP